MVIFLILDYLVEREINITTIITTNTTVYLSWEKSGADDDEYQLKLKAGEPLFEIDEGKCTIDDDSKNITTKDTEYTFEHLKPYYRYNVTIQYDTNIQEYSAETKASSKYNCPPNVSTFLRFIHDFQHLEIYKI